jgi:hypothetical protein
MSSLLRKPTVSPWVLATCAICATALAGCARPRPSSPTLVDPSATASVREARGLARFQRAMARYATLRDRVIRGTPEASPESLAVEIRRKRGEAKQGDVFRRDVQPLFRRAVDEELRDPLALHTRHTLGEGNPKLARGVERDGDIPARSITLVVNNLYPPGSSFSTMPPRLLQRLPALPSSIDYRFVGRDLVLLDTSASLVIDYLPNAVPIGR